MKRLAKIFLMSGLWLQPVMMYFFVRAGFWSGPPNYDDSVMWSCLILSFVPVILLWSGNRGTPSADKAMRGREKATYPEVPADMLFDTPTGIVFGKYKGKYVCRPLTLDGHIFVIGGTGTGKSSCIVIPTILVNAKCRIFAVDIKGELHNKATKAGDASVQAFDPADRNTCGYDPFYALDETSSTQEILETIQTIAFSLVAMPASVKDPFWKLSARNLLIGLMMYCYRQGTHDFIGIIDEILGRPTEEAIQTIMETASPTSPEYRYIVQFSSMAEETLGGIVAELYNHLVVFANDMDIRYAFRDNRQKISPRMLEEGYSIYLAIREEKLTAYYDVMQLIINQMLAELEKRPEGSEPIVMIIDELPRLLSAGKLDRLLDAMRTLRSRNVCLFLVTQSMEALMSAYTENEVLDLASNCAYTVVLSATSTRTQKQVVEWCGKYKERRQSWSGSGKDRRVTVSYEEKDIVQQSDLMALQTTGEEILITPYGYSRIKKAPYYLDKTFAPQAREIWEYNQHVKEIRIEAKSIEQKPEAEN
ncbi:MAG: type IV secretory system conjugative DNA transfer family protein [Lachnospiraceae bacterium]|nr:type IV secretory system conjugative DNA transfer family protein [Lachnospiraceae bacterium]